jgi:hypothetical protein
MSSAVPATRRDAYIDAMRGACVLAMLFFHLGAGTWAVHLTFAGSFAIFNGAEGFVFLSGLVFARVYQRRLREWGPAAAGRAVYLRVAQIYRWHLLLLLCLLCCAWLFPHAMLGASDRYELAIESPWTALWRGAIFVYQPAFFDILPLYVVFLPIAWILTKHEMLHARWLPIASIGLWASQQFAVTSLAESIKRGVFNPAAYQLLFALGLWFGAQPAASGVYRALRDVRIAAISVVACVACFVVAHPRHLGLPRETVLALLRFDVATDKDALGWLRVVNFLGAAHLAYYFRDHARRLPLGVLASLGKRSLEVFVAHLAWFLVFRVLNDRILREAGASVYGAYLTSNILAGTVALWAWDARKRRLEAPRARAGVAGGDLEIGGNVA